MNKIFINKLRVKLRVLSLPWRRHLEFLDILIINLNRKCEILTANCWPVESATFTCYPVNKRRSSWISTSNLFYCCEWDDVAKRIGCIKFANSVYALLVFEVTVQYEYLLLNSVIHFVTFFHCVWHNLLTHPIIYLTYDMSPKFAKWECLFVDVNLKVQLYKTTKIKCVLHFFVGIQRRTGSNRTPRTEN